jgi:formate C-acetyltransferase
MTHASGQTGPATGYLYEMESFDEVLAAYQRQVEYFVKWHAANINSFEYVARQNVPLPAVSCTVEGCMESGKDVMYGGAKFNSTGIAGIGIGNVADSLQMIKRLCFDEQRCTTRELYDALMNDWQGHEDLLNYVRSEAPHFGNGIEECDEWAGWAADVFAVAVNSCTGPRGRFSAGLYPVTANVAFGLITAATPDGRHLGEPLADGISPVQQMDKQGPTALLHSVSKFDQSKFPNGTLLNMKFHPTALASEEGVEKLAQLIKTYFFNMDGMEMQINVVTSRTLRNAQEQPDEYRDLVVRIAGFSVYFIEMNRFSQDDLISRTELTLA